MMRSARERLLNPKNLTKLVDELHPEMDAQGKGAVIARLDINLEIRVDQTPVELEILMIVGLLESQDEIDLRESVDRLQRLLESHQAVVDLRHYAAIAAYLQGEVNTRNSHLDWLLQNAPQDPRRPRWTELRRSR